MHLNVLILVGRVSPLPLEWCSSRNEGVGGVESVRPLGDARTRRRLHRDPSLRSQPPSPASAPRHAVSRIPDGTSTATSRPTPAQSIQTFPDREAVGAVRLGESSFRVASVETDRSSTSGRPASVDDATRTVRGVDSTFRSTDRGGFAVGERRFDCRETIFLYLLFIYFVCIIWTHLAERRRQIRP